MPPHQIFGAGGIGTTAKSFTYTWDTPEKVSELLNLLQTLNITELDSAAAYPPGNPENTETLLGQARAVQKGFIVDSKIQAYPLDVTHLNDEGIEASTARTLELLGVDKVRIMYVHAPEPKTPVEETAAAFDRQFREGKFEKLGLCNYDAAGLAEYVAACEKHGFIKPSVYQGCYNALYRKSEDELVPFLRKHGMKYYVYSPLAGGFLTGKVTAAIDSGDESALHRTRWRGESTMDAYAQGFDKPALHDGIRKLKKVCEANGGISLTEVSMRWLMHHSVLGEGDGIIFGAKTLAQVEANVAEARNGPLEGEVLAAINGLWDDVKGAFGVGSGGSGKEGEQDKEEARVKI
ncbi:NADP-dependent oxidoreductase domain-containing protein [Rhypophila decipiens]|uniref:NADP-dependent oxidoreductase domain-containing protein n=1 Tax=Rhypophila decipiens TaxID=261697 RepID=A0AAN7B167_9PEZI|nr:NADP-dependent oxidoreductase domain-containing protein [Rhypophila decipiens]